MNACKRCGRPASECWCGFPRDMATQVAIAASVVCVVDTLFDGAPSARSAWLLLLALVLREVTT